MSEPKSQQSLHIPPTLRAEIEAHAREEAPNEACGLLLLRGGRAERYVRGRNEAASPYRFRLATDDPEIWFLEDEGFELAVVHSHPPGAPTGPRPSRTDVEHVGLWEGRPYLILHLGTGELGGWRIVAGEPVPLPLT